MAERDKMVAIPQDFQDFLLNQPAQIDLRYFVLSLVMAALLAYILGKLYVKYGTAISNRKNFSRNFILLIPTTTLIITVVKSSLALSLGLVGALSIVRFRAAIKEPEELAFLFLAIGIGLGLGANQLAITLIAFVVIGIVIWGRHFYYRKGESQNLYLTVSGKVSKEFTLRRVVNLLKENCNSVKLKRFDKVNERLEASFLIDLDSFNKLDQIKEGLTRLSKDITVSYLDKMSSY